MVDCHPILLVLLTNFSFNVKKVTSIPFYEVVWHVPWKSLPWVKCIWTKWTGGFRSGDGESKM